MEPRICISVCWKHFSVVSWEDHIIPFQTAQNFLFCSFQRLDQLKKLIDRPEIL